MESAARLSRIADRLGTTPQELAFLQRLDDVRLEQLDAAIAVAQHHEDIEVDRSMREALRLVPPPLRRRASSALFPDAEAGTDAEADEPHGDLPRPAESSTDA